ncbi:MAG: signal recognition particle-docking protein FtsY [Sphaerochaetaceae bacterium]|jgi:fused signal recognition particle receptor|nr:signal recognition particle-docking protein FtsY [Sphaerochaetaceae bacterium]HHU88977.1 signal recognition particle-docking protein FtsY [Spirochaetales bacterium]
MKKTFGAKLKAFFKIPTFNEQFFEEFEDMLIEGDLGARTAMEISDAVRERAKEEKKSSAVEIQNLVKEVLRGKIEAYEPTLIEGETNLFLILGVNGVGKTTTIAKMATYYQNMGKSVLLSASDTFRAAAIDQLDLHAQRTGTRIVKQGHGADPGAVIFDAIQSGVARKDDLILADTAGRMHTKDNLLRELQKIDKVITSRLPKGGNYKRFLVIDATTGQNGVSQTELFNQAIGIDAIILTKYDSQAKGGSLIQIGERFSIPIALVGTGEKYGDLELFDKEKFLNTLVGIE